MSKYYFIIRRNIAVKNETIEKIDTTIQYGVILFCLGQDFIAVCCFNFVLDFVVLVLSVLFFTDFSA